MSDPVGGQYMIRGNNLRMTEYQAAIGLAQLKRLDEHTTLRNRNAAYLKSKISGIPGILPYKLYEHVTRAAFHLFPFRYKKEEFSNLSRDQFIRALDAEGIPAWSGYKGLLFSMPYLNDAFQSKNYQLMYPKRMLDFEKFIEQNQCPESERLSNETGIWFSQNLLLGTHSDMDDIYNAIEKIHTNSGKIKDSL
jgi:dTDP-4-amino-4,6-dideoxygalactose transaminase